MRVKPIQNEAGASILAIPKRSLHEIPEVISIFYNINVKKLYRSTQLRQSKQIYNIYHLEATSSTNPRQHQNFSVHFGNSKGIVMLWE